MGIIVDMCVFIAHERKGYAAKDLRANLIKTASEGSFALSSVSLAELVTGVYRAKTSDQHARRHAFVEEVVRSFPIISLTRETAWIAGKVCGEQAKLGNTLPTADAFIAATALEFHCAILTMNVQDFTRIPGLQVIPFPRP